MTHFGLSVTQLTLVMLSEKVRAGRWEGQPRHLSYEQSMQGPCPRCTRLRMQLLTTTRAPFTGVKTELREFKKMSFLKAHFRVFISLKYARRRSGDVAQLVEC